MATVYVDNTPYPMNPSQNLLHGCLSNGLNLPYFCWHPALGSVGACRQCAIKQFKDEHDTRGKLVMACLTPASEGARISIEDTEAAAFRKSVIEGLMLNHPHDCPVCDEGGECHLQDMTVMTGHDYRSYRFHKRTFRNQDLGPLVNHEMNRCIQCYRCVRYYREYAGGEDLNAFSLHDTVFFGRETDGVLENEFSGNLVEICPTGVFTDKTLKRHYTRKWDQLFAPSICPHCAVGCNISAGERYGTLRRIVNRFHHDVNGYFLCDRGRYGYEFVNSPNRLRQPLLHGRPISASEAAGALREAIENGSVIGIGSPRASLEGNFALRTLAGPARFFSGMAEAESRLTARSLAISRGGFGAIPTPHEIESCDAVLILGEDPTNFAPRIALSVRQAARQSGFEIAEKLKIPFWLDRAVRDATQHAKSPVYIATPYATRLDEVAAKTFRAAPAEIARLGFAIAHALDSSAPVAEGSALANEIAAALKSAKCPLILSGQTCGSEAVLEAAANIAIALGRARGQRSALWLDVPECNNLGAALLGGRPLESAFEAVKNGAADTVIILENDLYRRAPAAEVDAFLDKAKHVICLDSLLTRTVSRAGLALPAATFAESDGTFISAEGRAQRFFQVFEPGGEVDAGWRWLRHDSWTSLDHVLAALASEIPDLAGARDAAPSAHFRMAGAKIPRAPHRYSGRTAMTANIRVSEPKPPTDPDSPFTFSMEGNQDHPPAPLIPFFWEPGWNSIQATNFYQREIGEALRGGASGVRLLDRAPSSEPAYFDSIPAPFEPREGEWLLVPIHHIFGSGELSACAPGIAELTPRPYVAVPAEAHFEPGTQVEVHVDGQSFRLPVRVRAEMPRGTAGLPMGLAPLTGIRLPARGTIVSAV